MNSPSHPLFPRDNIRVFAAIADRDLKVARRGQWESEQCLHAHTTAPYLTSGTKVLQEHSDAEPHELEAAEEVHHMQKIRQILNEDSNLNARGEIRTKLSKPRRHKLAEGRRTK